MKKRILSLILCFIMALLLLPTAVFAEESEVTIVASGTCGTNLTWKLDDEGTLTISGTGAMKDYSYSSSSTAPWHSNKGSIKSVVIEHGVTSIGNYAFYNCTNLASITIPDEVASIGVSAFFGCRSLTSIAIPDEVTSIGVRAFFGCKSLPSVEIPNSVTSIGEGAFEGCESLERITIPNSVTSIGYGAFSDCTSLPSIEIPNSVTSIGNSVFRGCTALENITVDKDNAEYCTEDGILFNKAKTTLVTYPANKAKTSYVIPDSITSIGDWAFNGCTSLTSITIPDSVTSIGIGALEGCESLASITIPDEVTSIDVRAFFGCKSLTSIAIPDGVTSIGGGTFMWCSSLTSVTIPDSVTSIAESAFFGCRSLTSITIPDSVTSIGDDAFGYCRSLTSVTIPDSVTSIGNYAFYNCTNLVIYGFAGSYAQSYAKTNDIAFELIQVPVTGVSLDKKTLSLYTGESATLTAMIAPSNATNINVFWSSTNETAVTVSEGTLTANAAGTAIITARTEDGNKVATCVVTVTDRIVVATLTLDKSVLDIKSGNSEKLNVIFNPEYTTDKTVTWLSLDESIATVDENGVVKGIGEGSTTIIVMSNSGNKSASCTVNVTEPITYSFGQSVQIGLIEPWFLKANARVYTVENPINIDYSTLVDYGAYFIRKSELSDKNATQDTLAVEDIINDSDTVKYSKSAGTATVDGSYITASYDKGLYTYEMSDSIFVLFYIEDESGMSYAPIRERNMKELLEKRKNDTENFENVLERNVYTAMDKLELNIGVYRAQFDEIDELPVMSAPRLSDYVAENGAFEEETAKSYSFGNSVQIILVEPWGLKFNARVYNGANPTNINYGSIEEYGAIVYYDTEGNAESMTAEELRTKSDAYVFSSKNGDATIDGSYITALYNKGIYTYQLDSNAYVMFYVKDENGYHYGDVKVRNAYELAKVRAQDTTGNFGEQEKQVYLDMVEMYEAVKAYRDDYFANN